MLWGYLILFTADALLTLAGFWLLRSPRFGDSPPVSVAFLATLVAVAVHVLAYTACQTLLVRLGEATADDVGSRMDLFIANMLCGVVPAMIFGYVLVFSFANMFSMQISMMDKKPEPISTDAFRHARGLAAQGQTTAAIEECRKLAARFPDSPLPLLEIALMQKRGNRVDEAADTLRALLREFPHASETRRRATLLLADIMEFSLDDPETAAYLRNGCKTAAKSPEAAKPVPQWIEMEHARHLAERGDIDRAVTEFREVFRRNPDAPRPLLEAATILERVGRPDDAAGVLRALAHASKAGSETWAEATYRLANLLGLYFDDPEARLHALQEILRKAPGSKAANLAREMLRRDADRLTDI